MKLTDRDKVLLKSWGHPKSDFPQIEDAIRKTVYTLDGRRVSREKVINLLGRRTYLSGISRSAFHFTTYRENENDIGIMFDSSALFK